MLIPMSWLKELVDLNGVDAQEIENGLFSCGLEVEEKNKFIPEVSGVYVGVVKSIVDHPNSDHLHICVLDCGEKGNDIQIVTGAQNVFAGAHVPCALDGARVFGRDGAPAVIKNGKLRGETSDGMLCSGGELGIDADWIDGGDVNGILIFPDDSVAGQDVRDYLKMNDEVWDVSITANLPHCQSVYGIARELGAVLNRQVKCPDHSYTEYDIGGDDIKVTVNASDLCPRYIGHYVSDIKLGRSPEWMRRRLKMCGHNPINNIVDITNYVLVEIGQPMHAFNLETLEGREIVVRRAENGEKITTLDEKEFTLNENNLVICDGRKPVALAGIMGGLNSEISEGTHDVLFEAAKFARDNIRKSSRALGQISDSSQRFTKGVDEYGTNLGMSRALHLIEELDCGKVSRVHRDVRAEAHKNAPVVTTFEKINSVLGIKVPDDVIVDILRRMNYEVAVSGDTVSATAPEYRDDVESYPDLAEDVIKAYGYDKIVPTFLADCKITSGGLTDAQLTSSKMKKVMVSNGFYEVMNFSFYSPGELALLRLDESDSLLSYVKISNPISENYSIMRTTLIPSMIRVTATNNKRAVNCGRVFEMANVFTPNDNGALPSQGERLAFSLFGGNNDFFSAKGVFASIEDAFRVKFAYERATKNFLHPGRSAKVTVDGDEIGFFGQLSYEVAEASEISVDTYVGEIDMQKLFIHLGHGIAYKNVSKFPDVERDLALVVNEEMTCGDIERVIKQGCKSLKDVRLFDVYRSERLGTDKKSMAFKLRFSAGDAALAPEEVDKMVDKILSSLKARLGIELRTV